MMMKRIILGISIFLLLASCVVENFATQSPVATVRNPGIKFQEEFLSRINRLREKGCNCGNTYMPPAPPLVWNTQLELAALAHAQDMNRNKYFDHKSKDGRTIKDRITGAGYTPTGYRAFIIGENIAWGQRSIKEVMDGWIGSPAHCRNLMKPDFKEVGIAFYNSYWVQDFGGRYPFARR
ncbi:CAP domain-containing protein [Pedobacter sp. SYSU D00535]|uniref:CAP domain-containing protein n=1 Tax=Pedobacter sp. SYSU D00535 TaxID=2810308 RepID=UPI001A9627C2|nr:CAP domain-containing protein [Pedobacter sp. SYSU D00535]